MSRAKTVVQTNSAANLPTSVNNAWTILDASVMISVAVLKFANLAGA